MSEIIKNETKKKICLNCGLEKNEEKDYYLSRITKTNGQYLSKMNICKECLKKEFHDSTDIYLFFKKYNLPFFVDIMNNIIEKYEPNLVLGEYMKTINSLPQYRNLTWKDSILESVESKSNKKDDNFYDSIINNLKKEANKLSNRLTKLSDSQNTSNDYIATIKALKETLELINKYDWQLQYNISQYKEWTTNEDTTKILIWEQNHENQVRNNKSWTIKTKDLLFTEDNWNTSKIINNLNNTTIDAGNTIGNSLKNIKKEEFNKSGIITR